MLRRWICSKIFLAIAVVTLLIFVAAGLPAKTSHSRQAVATYLYPRLPETSYNYENITLPEHFLVNRFPGNVPGQNAVIENDNTPLDNQTTDAGATLGRVLFYDKRLSANRTIACASCHQQALAFTDDATLSVGFESGTTRRHAMSLANARFYDAGKMFWDERASSLEDQALQPILDPIEMGLTLTELLHVVEHQPYYSNLFIDAFGDATVTPDRIAKAIAQFERSLVSYSSKYDEGRALVNSPFDPFPNFSMQENFGKDLFMKPNVSQTPLACIACHMSEAFITPFHNPANTTDATNNGLDIVSSNDFGVLETTGNPADDFKFRVPSLRNIAVTAPYMHDGRFQTLNQVLNFYSNGIQPHPNLDPRLRGPNPGAPPVRFNFNPDERAALIAFFETLTDQQLINDIRFSDPFVETTLAVGKKLLDGIVLAGSIDDLGDSDDISYVLSPSPTANPQKQKIDMILIGISPVTHPTRLRFLVESAITGPADESINMEIQILNHETNQMESLGFWLTSNEQKFVEVDVVADSDRFVHPITNEIRGRIIWSSPIFSGSPFFWEVEVNTAVWMLEENANLRSGNSGSGGERSRPNRPRFKKPAISFGGSRR